MSQIIIAFKHIEPTKKNREKAKKTRGDIN